MYLTIVYTRWRKQRKKWGLLYPTFGTTFRIQKVGMKNKEPSGDFVQTFKIKIVGTRSLVRTLYLT